MNKYIIEALKEYEFSFEKNYAYGHINDYEVNIVLNPTLAGPAFCFSTYLEEEKKKEFIKRMKALKMPLLQVTGTAVGVIVIIGAWVGGKEYAKKIGTVLPKILEILDELGAKKRDICPQSGQPIDETNSKLITIPDSIIKVTLSNDVITTINKEVDNYNETYENAPNNYLKGFGGILLGALAGVAAMFVSSMLGFVSVIAPLVSILVGIHLYTKFKAKPNHVMIIMSFITTIVVLLGTLFLMYIGVSNSLMIEAGLLYRGVSALDYCLKNVEGFKESFRTELVMNGVFILIAEAFSIFRLVNSVKKPKKIDESK